MRVRLPVDAPGWFVTRYADGRLIRPSRWRPDATVTAVGRASQLITMMELD
ncbi:hypothetical protein GKJPGBOP_01566 [Streptomyces paromomycinus]|uniref:Uncharacterized protein n=1 Tax=Streptomyces paromomycinus TaxID=92743 RepID=A0A401VXV3_STREY|nr:hypothetical protein GKJPGBOP_01566 [Streptomyces paromomycinus]